jgi:excisionase family DNA binding protein
MPEDVTEEVRRARGIAVRDVSRGLYATPRSAVEALLNRVTPSAPSSTQSAKPATEPKKAGPASAVLATVTETPGRPTPGRGGAQHKYLQSLIRKLAEDRGFDVTVERSVLDGHGYVDVVLEKAELSIACEISVTTRVAHEIDNLSKCLASGFSYAVLIALDPRALEQARADFGTELSDRVRFMTADDFIAFLDEFAVPDTEQTPGKRKKGNQGQVTAAAAAPGSDTKRLLGTKEAAEYLGLAVQTLAKMRVSGDSPPFFKLGRQVMYDREELDAWVTERRRRSTSDTGRPTEKGRPLRS